MPSDTARPLAESSALALKEWAIVLEAIAQARQCVLIRKGGLADPGKAFAFPAPSFVFYPTYEHQTVSFVVADYQAIFEQTLARRALAEIVRFELAACVAKSVETRDAQILKRLEGWHIYTDAMLSQRLKWQPDQPLTIAYIRAYRLAEPVQVAVHPSYAGCKSWVDLQTPISLKGARPVMADALFEERLAQFNARLSTG